MHFSHSLAASLAACALLAVACAEHGPPAAHRLEIQARLFTPAATGATPMSRPCGVGNDLRPALGCPQRVKLERVDAGGPSEPLRFRIPAAHAGTDLLVERMSRRDDLDPWRTLPSLLVAGDDREFSVPLRAPEGHERRVLAYRAPPARMRHVSRELRVPEDTRLRGAIAFLSPAAGAETVMRIDALVDGDIERLWEERIVPEELGGTWQDYDIDLSELAGESVQLALSATPVRGTVRPGESTALFSKPRIVAPSAVGEEQLRHIFLISIDTLRADHVGTYGGERAQTPRLDAFAAEGVVFESAMTTFPATTAAHMSMLTGMYPLVHRVYQPTRALSARIPTLAEVLAADGFATAAVTENAMVHANSGFSRGFDSYREFKESVRRRTTGHIEEVVASGLEWLDGHLEQKTFLFLHTYQVHGPYEPPEAYDVFDSHAATTERERAARAYAGEITYADAVLGGFFDALEERGILDDSLVIVTADHGEDFGHHAWGHGLSLHEEAVRIPLILRAPGRLPPARRDAPVSLVDVMPTILDLAGVEPTLPVQGRSLLPLARAATAPGFRDRAVHAERLGGKQLAIRQRETKWILTDREPPIAPSVFDLAADAREKDPSAPPGRLASGEQIAQGIRRESAALRQSIREGTTSVPLDEATLSELRALGYIE